MSSDLDKASFARAIIILLAAFTINVSAQIPVDANSSAAKADSTRGTRDKDVETKSLLAAEGAETTAGPEKTAVTRAAEPTSPQTTPTDVWQFQLTPYLWIPTISGRAGIGNLITDTSVSVRDSDIELNFGFMGTFEARKNRFIILTDLQYSDLATEGDNPGPLFSSTRSSFKTFVFDPEIGYRILDNGNGATLDVLGGVRYWHLDATLAFRAGILPAVEVSRTRSWIDGVAGLRGKAALSERWFVAGKADLGGGGSNFTYQLFGGVGVNVGERFALIGGYRDLNVNYNKDGFLFDMSLHGPIFGLGIRF